jgi:transposase InsO family protein
VLGVDQVKSISYVPLSHPFVERLIGTIRRECLDRTLFWSVRDLDKKLSEFQTFFNDYRTHSSLDGRTPAQNRDDVATLDSYAWEEHCRGLYQTPTAA